MVITSVARALPFRTTQGLDRTSIFASKNIKARIWMEGQVDVTFFNGIGPSSLSLTITPVGARSAWR